MKEKDAAKINKFVDEVMENSYDLANGVWKYTYGSYRVTFTYDVKTVYPYELVRVLDLARKLVITDQPPFSTLKTLPDGRFVLFFEIREMFLKA